MATSITLVLTSLLYSSVAAYFWIRLRGLWHSRTKAPYAILLASGIILQLVTYVLLIFNFAFLAFLPRRKQIPLLAIIAACLFRLLPLLLIVCTVRALHARLSALTAARPPAQEVPFKLARYGDWFQLLLLAITWVFLSIESRVVSDALNGRRGHRPPSLLDQLGELIHALTFTSLTYTVLVFSRRMNGFLLLPDKVLFAINTRIAPLFLFRSTYTVIDAILPLMDPKIRILTPSLTISADGFIWLIAFYNLSVLAHPDDNWIGQDSAHLVHGITAIEEGQSSTIPGEEEDNLHDSGQSVKRPSRWSRLLSASRPHRMYGSTRDGGDSTSLANTDQDGPLPDVAIVHGVTASGTQVYAQTGPMAPAWLMNDVAVDGKAIVEPIRVQH